MLSPPKLSQQQEQIYQALVNSVGSKISLKYPKSGSYLSAFVVADIDDEPSEEAIVFYEKVGITADESSLRISVLDQRDDRWQSVYDMPVAASEIEKVIISKLGHSPETAVVIGYSMTQGEMPLNIYKYSDGILSTTFTCNYSSFDVADFDNDQLEELLIISGNSASSKAEAVLLKPDGNESFIKTSVPLSESSSDYGKILYGSVNNSTNGIYIDSVTSANTIITEILYVQEGTLKNTFSETAPSYSRPSGYSCIDIDGDGVVEIPMPCVFKGYENLPETEQLASAEWLVYENNSLIRKYYGYLSINDGYTFMFPESWIDKVTAKTDSATQEIVFYEYGGDITAKMPEIMRICVTDSKSAENLISEGYILINSKGDTCYLVKITENKSGIKASLGDAVLGFMLIQ